MKINHIIVNDYLTKSNLPESDYVINPYVGCPHACAYCYACFMKRFTNHNEDWGSFLDVKECEKPISLSRIKGKSVFLSSVTDCYNPYEEDFRITRKILEQLINADCQLTISTKSKLILRDTYLLKQCKNLKVDMSINTLDEKFQSDMDNASSISDRLKTLKALHENGIYTVLFMSPIFPYITDFKAIIEKSKNFIDTEDTEDKEMELEADNYSRNMILNDNIYKEFVEKNNYTKERIIKFAKDNDIHPGIVVGRLQHDGKLGWNMMGELKQRYRWVTQ